MEFYPPNKITSVPTGATAFPSRMARCNINFVPRWKDAALDSKARGIFVRIPTLTSS